jgi:glycosyltransferase involved in cell wall biosynthesis
MKILILHSRYASGTLSGENRVVDDEVALLRDAGHSVWTWTPESTASAPELAASAIWSAAAAKRTEELIRRTEADVVHFHNLFPNLSPAALRAAGRTGKAVVMTLHNFRLLCLPATLLRNGQPCELCVGRSPWRGVAYRCYRGSYVGSGALFGSLTLHRTVGSFNEVDRFLAVSSFVADKHLAAGFSSATMRVKTNFTSAANPEQAPGDYFLYLGRLSAEKGIETLVRHWPDGSQLVVAGDGPSRQGLERSAGPDVRFLGSVEPLQARELAARARALVVPSRCYEGAPRAIQEAFARGVPVLASRIGGLPELVSDGENGFLLRPDDYSAWHDAIRRLGGDGSLRRRMGANAKKRWEAQFSPERGLADLEAAYAEAVEFRQERARV